MKKFVILIAVFSIFLSFNGCTHGFGVQSSDSVQEGITISKLNLFEDHYGGRHIVGEIRNDTSFPVQSIDLEIAITDADRDTVLRNAEGKPIQEDIFHPFLNLLFPGESSGFDYSLSPQSNTAVSYQVIFSSAKKSTAEKADVRIEHAHIQKSMYGTSFLMGEVVNHGPQPARVEGLGVTVLGYDGQILDTNDASNSGLFLAPAKDPGGMDRISFSIPLHGSFGNDAPWEGFISAVVTEQKNIPTIHVLESHQYMDAFGFLHLVALIENGSSSPLSIPIVGSLLDKNGDVLDSVEGFLPVDVPPGSNAAIDLVDWKVVNHNVSLQAMIRKTQIQIDSSHTSLSKLRYFQLIPSNIQESRADQGVWIFRGRVNNFWSEAFRRIVVIVSIFSDDNHLIAINYQWVRPLNPLIAMGRNAQFNLQVSLDPTQDPSKYTYRIQAMAEAAW